MVQPGCPFVKKHYENARNTFNKLNKDYSEKGRDFPQRSTPARKQEGAGRGERLRQEGLEDQYSILIDETTMRSAKALPRPSTRRRCSLSTRDGTIAYHAQSMTTQA